MLDSADAAERVPRPTASDIAIVPNMSFHSISMCTITREERDWREKRDTKFEVLASRLRTLTGFAFRARPACPARLSIGLTWAIDEIAWPRRRIGSELLGLTGRDILLQSFQEPENFHVLRRLA